MQNTGKVGKEKVIYRSDNEIFDVDANKIREDYYIIGKDLKIAMEKYDTKRK